MDVYHGKLFKNPSDLTKHEIASFDLINAITIISIRKGIYHNIINSPDKGQTAYGLPGVMSSKFIVLALLDYAASIYNLISMVDEYFEKTIVLPPKLDTPSVCQIDVCILKGIYDDDECNRYKGPLVTIRERLSVYRNRFTHGSDSRSRALKSTMSIWFLVDNHRDEYEKIVREFNQIAIDIIDVVKKYLYDTYEHVFIPAQEFK